MKVRNHGGCRLWADAHHGAIALNMMTGRFVVIH
jgi:hypothetical protein